MKILVPFDGSELALTALAAATRLAREQDGELLLLTVGEIAETHDEAASIRSALTRVLDKAASSVQDVAIKTRVELAEDAATAIERVAEDEAVDLIVMAPPGNRRPSSLVQAGATDAAVRETPDPTKPVAPAGELGDDVKSPAVNPHPNAEEVEPARIALSLLGPFGLTVGGEPAVLNRGTQRLVAFVALQGHAVSRDVIAEGLWPEVHQERSLGRLRSAIWRLEPGARSALSIDVVELDLSPQVDLDLAEARALAHQLVHGDELLAEEVLTPLARAMLSSDLLPEWSEEWAVFEAEDWRQLRLHALEALAQKLLDLERYSDALEIASEAKKADPLRETPRALMIRIYLAEGNQSEAIREFLSFRQVLQDELGIPPTPQLRNLMRGLS